jgi:hypothetical protein
MKLDTRTNELQTEGQLSSASFGISLNDQAHITEILRSRLYSDKPMAVLREYCTNAVDAHVEAGIPDRPIKVTMPSRFDSVLKIRDFGPGLSEEQVYNVYTQYGASTKRSSNTVTGMLGIGCKAGFSYSDTFTVISWQGGKKNTYSAFIDPSNRGTMSLLSSQPCALEETGVEIQIPIALQDIGTFHSKATALFKYFSVTPDTSLNIKKNTYSISTPAWGLRNNTDGNSDHVHFTGPVAIMGNIGYPIVPSRLNNMPEDMKSILTSTPIDFFFPIGALSIAANREDLEYTDKTISAIKTSLELVIKQLEESFKQKLSNCKNSQELRRTWCEFFNSSVRPGYISQTSNLVRVVANRNQHYTVDGERINLSESRLSLSPSYNKEGEVLLEFGLLQNINGCSQLLKGRKLRYSSYDAARDPHFFAVEVDCKPPWAPKAFALKKQYEKDHPEYKTANPVLVFRSPGATSTKEYFKSVGFPDIDILNLSTYNPDLIEESQVVPEIDLEKVLQRKKKVSKKVFKLNTQSYVSVTTTPSNNFEQIDIDFEEAPQVWFVISSFRPTAFTTVQLRTMLDLLVTIKGAPLTTDIIALKPDMASEVPSDWISFETFFAQEVEKFFSSIGNPIDIINSFQLSSDFTQMVKKQSIVKQKLDQAGISQDNLLRKYYDSYERAALVNTKLRTLKNINLTSLRDLASTVMSNYENSTLTAINTELVKKYPLAFDSRAWITLVQLYNYTPENYDYIIDNMVLYIKLMDEEELRVKKQKELEAELKQHEEFFSIELEQLEEALASE